MSLGGMINEAITDFYLPVILPEPNLGDPLTYYHGLEAQGVSVTVVQAGSNGPMEITVANPQVNHTGTQIPVSTVVASTSGFVDYDLGNIVLRIWPKDYDDLARQADDLRPNRIILGGLDATSVQSAIELVVKGFSTLLLQESWTEGGGTGAFPNRGALETALVHRFMTGTASIFVESGTPLGRATIDPNDPLKASLTLQAIFDPFGADPPVNLASDDFIDNAVTLEHIAKFAGHPLVKAISGPIAVPFRSRFLVWNNVIFNYEPLLNTEVTLLASAPAPLSEDDFIPTITMGTAITDPVTGRIDLTVVIPSRAMISFRYKTTGQTFGNRVYPKDVETNAHKARQYLDPNLENTIDYKAKYEIYPQYQAFIDDLANNQESEPVGEDRGNAGWQDLSATASAASILPDILEPNLIFSQSDRLGCIAAFESFHKRRILPSKATTFNVLVEGDSWLNYPLAFNDIFGQFDQMIWDRLRPGISYNRIPLQHFGDRGDQMFLAVAGKTRQWNFTEDFLREYQIDLIVCSAGGNDFAEPGIGNKTKLKPYKDQFTDGYFDPYKAKMTLSPDEMATAEKLMRRSFAVLLKNHLWHAYLFNHTQKDEAAMSATLDPLLQAVGSFAHLPDIWPMTNDLAPIILQPIGDSVIANFPDEVLPPPAAALLNEVFDQQLFGNRYADVTNLLKVLLTKADQLGIPVITHTYCYPLFNENPSSILGLGREDVAGPWFWERFREARIVSRVIEKICLKSLLDRYVATILNPLKSLYPLFDYVDVRNLNPFVDVWRDEMHLRANGYRKLAEKVFEKILANPKIAQYF